MDRLLAIGEKHGIPVIEDAAEAIGSIYHGKRAGSMGKFGAFSFHGTKTLTTGEGGMFVTDDPELYEHVLTLSNHGRARGQTKQFWPDMVGFKYKMSNIQAAIGCAQMERIDELIERKRESFASTVIVLRRIQAWTMNPEPPGTVIRRLDANGCFRCRATGVTRENLQAAFCSEEYRCTGLFWPSSPLLKQSKTPEIPPRLQIPARAINLPSYHDMIAKRTAIAWSIRYRPPA